MLYPRGKTTALAPVGVVYRPRRERAAGGRRCPPGKGSTPQLLDEELAAILHGFHVRRLPWTMFVPGPLLLHCR